MDKLLFEFIEISSINPQPNGLWQVEFPIVHNKVCYVNDCSGPDDIHIKIDAYNHVQSIMRSKGTSSRSFIRESASLINNN